MPSPRPPKPPSSCCASSFMFSDRVWSGRLAAEVLSMRESGDAYLANDHIACTGSAHAARRQTSANRIHPPRPARRRGRGRPAGLRDRRAGPVLSRQARAPDRHLPARRQLGPDGAHHRREARRGVEAAGDHREPARRRRLHRHGLRGAPAGRRLHLRDRQPRAGAGQPDHPEGAVQHGEGLRAGVAGGDRPNILVVPMASPVQDPGQTW